MQMNSLKDNAYQLIKKKLLSNQFAPGTRIREDFLAEEISISRTPVREAINKLVSEGLIKSIPRRGLYFIELTQAEIEDLIDVRGALEILSVEKCIDEIDEKRLGNLKGIVERAEESLKKNDIKTCNYLDSLFHQEIAKCSGNRRLIKYLMEIEEFMQIVRTMEKKTEGKQKVEKSLQQHWEIFNSIKARDKAEARKAVMKNIEQLRSHLGMKK